MRKVIPIIVLLCGTGLIALFGIFCSSSGSGESGGEDVSVRPSSLICPKLPKCFNNAYPAFIGYDKASCMSTLNKQDTELLSQLLDAEGNCEEYRNLLYPVQIDEACKVLQECLDSEVFDEKLGGSMENCKSRLLGERVSDDLANCIYSAYRDNKNCTRVNLCISATQQDIGLDSIFADTGEDAGEKACITDTDTYNCEAVCDKFHSCTGLYCPPEAGQCTRDDCINGCKDPIGQFTIDLMCCIALTDCASMEQCYK